MARVNIVKQIKVEGSWVLRSIPRKPSGSYDWAALPDGTYFIEWRENGQRKREPAGITASQALEDSAEETPCSGGTPMEHPSPAAQQNADVGNSPLHALIDRYLEQIGT